MKALLLCAGLGTRLRPVTNQLPKVLVPINGKPLLEYWLDNLSQAGVQEFLINTHYLSEKIETFVANSKYKGRITLVYEKELLNTAGPIVANKSFFDKDEAFLLVHADNISFCDFKEFINTHKNRPKKCDITMMIFKTDTPSSCGIVELDNMVVKRFYEKVQNPPSNLANGAVYICEYSIINFLETLGKKNIDFSLDVIPNYMGKISAYFNEIYHRDIGTIESYALSQVEVSSFFNKNI